MLKRIGSFAAIIAALFYLLVLYLLAFTYLYFILHVISKTPKNLSSSIYSETLLETAWQHLLLLVGFDTLIYRKYYGRSPILVGHQDYFLVLLSGSEKLLVSGIGKENFYCKCCLYFCLLLYIIMEPSDFETLFETSFLTALLIAIDPPPAKRISFKIPMRIVERVINNRYQDMELSILLITCFLYMNYAGYLRLHVSPQNYVRGNYSLYC